MPVEYPLHHYCPRCQLPLRFPGAPCADDRCYQPSTEALSDKPGYPYNTNRGVPKVRYEASREEMMSNKGERNLGHGHVWPRTDGVRARCGGAGLCEECSRDYVERHGQPHPNSKVMDTGKALSDAAQLGISFIPVDQPLRPGLDQAGDTPQTFTPQTGQNSARRMLERLEPDEPVFVLRGNDCSAAMFVRSWISLQELNPSPPWAKIRRAREILAAMEARHRDGKTKWPD